MSAVRFEVKCVARSGAAAQRLRKATPGSSHGCACGFRLNVRALPVHAKTPGDRIQRVSQRPRVVTVPVKIFLTREQKNEF